jgi:hypothetical protein
MKFSCLPGLPVEALFSASLPPCSAALSRRGLQAVRGLLQTAEAHGIWPRLCASRVRQGTPVRRDKKGALPLFFKSYTLLMF